MKYLLPLVLFSAIAMGTSRADMVTYNVSLDTGFLTGLGSPFTFPPYYLDFQFFEGDTSEPTPNTVTVTSTGGQFASFVLMAGDFISGDDLVPFTPADPTTFTLSFTENIEPELTPDLLSIYICDMNSACLATEDPSGADSILDFAESLDPAHLGISEVDTFDTSTRDLNPTAELVTGSVPEPRTWVLSSFGFLTAFLWARRRTQTPSAN